MSKRSPSDEWDKISQESLFSRFETGWLISRSLRSNKPGRASPAVGPLVLYIKFNYYFVCLRIILIILNVATKLKKATRRSRHSSRARHCVGTWNGREKGSKSNIVSTTSYSICRKYVTHTPESTKTYSFIIEISQVNRALYNVRSRTFNHFIRSLNRLPSLVLEFQTLF
jgi:hypothetical protein